MINLTDFLIVLSDKSLKGVVRREVIINLLTSGELPFSVIEQCADGLDDKKKATVLEAMEEISRSDISLPTANWLHLAQKYINSDSNSLKREASRVVGNIAHLFPYDLSDVISALKVSTFDTGTIVRWAAAYALSRIVVIEQYAKSELYEYVVSLCEKEEDSGVKNQYVKALKKVQKLR